jgi:hypothetical protein
MPQLSTLEYVAELVIRRVCSEIGHGPGLNQALVTAYPFGDDPVGYGVWVDTLARLDLLSHIPDRPPKSTKVETNRS